MDNLKRVPERYWRLLWLQSSADTRGPSAIFDMRSVCAALERTRERNCGNDKDGGTFESSADWRNEPQNKLKLTERSSVQTRRLWTGSPRAAPQLTAGR